VNLNLGLLEADAKDEEQVSQMFDANEIAHQQIQAVIETHGVTLPSWPMAAVYPPDDSWVSHHADEHTLWAGILEIDNPGDLAQYDLKNERQFARWIDLHVQHHQLVDQALDQLVTGVASSSLLTSGAGYKTNDVLSVSGGQATTTAQFQVSAVDSGGAITGYSLYSAGNYINPPTSPVSVTGGSGSGATFVVTWSLV
jgi:hypothetical protein